MKNFNNLNEILAFQLEAMYIAEKKLQVKLTECTREITNKQLKREFKKYHESAGDKRLKLKRIFSYLLVKPSDRKSKPILKMLEEMKAISLSSTPAKLKDAQFLGSLQSICPYKAAIYSNCKSYASQLDLKAVSELLSEILAWESETINALTRIAIESVYDEAGSVALVE